MTLIQTPLVIIPGWGGDHASWTPFVEEAKKRFRNVSVIDLPGFGNEPLPSTVWGVEEYTKFVSQRLRSSFKTPIFLLGHSFGGAVATLVARKDPHMVRGLILIGAAIIRPPHYFKRSLSWSFRTIGKPFFHFPFVKHYAQCVQRGFQHFVGAYDYEKTEGIKRSIFRKIIREDLRHVLKDIQTPTLILWGANDSMTPIRHGKKIMSLIPHATLRIHPTGRHGLHITESSFVIDTIVDFSSFRDL